MVKLEERIPGFVQLDDTTSIYRPPNKHDATTVTLQNKQQKPDLIVFCSWMSAAPKHVAKYMDGYQKLFPNTSILLVEAKLRDILFDVNTFSAATDILRTHIETKPPLAHRTGPSILLHASSNGGANNAVTLASLLKRQGYAAPFDAITLDCSPGKAEFHSGARAIRLSLPNILFLRTWSIVFIYLALILYRLINFVLNRTDTITGIRTRLNDRALFGVNVPRLYLYSRADVLVEARHVSEHAKEANGKGCGTVEEEVFEKAPHCALLNEGRERYWGAVERHVRARR